MALGFGLWVLFCGLFLGSVFAVDPNGYWAVVGECDLHVCAEDALADFFADGVAHFLAKLVVEWF